MGIDTQGMGAPMTPEEAAKFKNSKQEYQPATVTPRRLFTPSMAKELKILINEVLDEREGKMDYQTYFDPISFRHLVTEEEPPYDGYQCDLVG